MANSLESYFSKFRKNIIGIDQDIQTAFHESIRVVYADWTASGRNYKVIEENLQNKIMPFVANTHTDTNHTGMAMTYAYHEAQKIIKKHVNAGSSDVLISSNSGMTGVVNKFQRILGLKVHESFKDKVVLSGDDKPVIFITHMEHHSNQTTWLETLADVVIIPPAENGLVCPDNFEKVVQKYASRKMKIASITACSNVTGIRTPYHEIAKIIHKHDGYCFVDFACSAPYVDIDMHPEDPEAYLDAIMFSPHKFLGGPGASGILVFNEKLYTNVVPDNPGGGTVEWTNPWGEHSYIENIEAREDGGTPSFIQTIKVAMCISLKEDMGVDNILAREEEQLELIWEGMGDIPGLHILASEHKDRLGVISFYIDGLHYIAGVKMLNDRFGIQTRGGCSCAGTYGHYLLNVSPEISGAITTKINTGDCSTKPGWIRMSIHPSLTDDEVRYIIAGIKAVAENHKEWINDYDFDFISNSIKPKNSNDGENIKGLMDEALTIKSN